MKTWRFLVLVLLAGCASERPGAIPPGDVPAVAERGGAPAWLEPLLPGDGTSVVEREFVVAHGEAAVRRIHAASSSIVAVFYAGLPRPITGPEGRTTFAGPGINVAIRENGRWLGWKRATPQPLPDAVGARLDAILADPALWREPDHFPRGDCTDAGSLQLVVRHQGRRKLSAQDNCRSRGLSGELGRIVLDERLATP